MKQGSRLVVANGSGEFSCYFVSWADDTHINVLNRFGCAMIISQNDIIIFFV